jgi:S-DNA-T family DNA segregation ATPase FtsK/SpoIIIE
MAQQETRDPVFLPIGLTGSGQRHAVMLRGTRMTIYGVAGSGKTSLINVLVALLAACPDALIWMIDMRGGRIARPWVVPWLQGRAFRPVIDWVATTREEAKVMLESALLAARTCAVHPGPGDTASPAVIVVCDDATACFGRGRRDDGITGYGLSRLGAEFAGLGGSLITATQPGGIGMQLRAQSGLRVGLRVTSVIDAVRIFPDHAQAARLLTKLRDRGDCLVMHGPEISEVVHLYRIGSEEQITSRAEWSGAFRPEPGQQLQDMMGEVYASRWERNGDLLDAWRESAG